MIMEVSSKMNNTNKTNMQNIKSELIYYLLYLGLNSNMLFLIL